MLSQPASAWLVIPLPPPSPKLWTVPGRTHVRLVPDGIEFVPTPLIGSHELGVPGLPHPLVELSWREGRATQRRVVSIDRFRITFVELPASDLELHPFGAGRYRLRRARRQRARILIAYARTDGDAAAESVRNLIAESGLSATLVAVDSPDASAAAALDQAQHLVLVLTPAASGSVQIRDVLRSARQRGVQVALVSTFPAATPPNMPRWLRGPARFDLFDAQQRLAPLTRVLAKPPSVRPVPFLAPPVEPLSGREREFLELKRALLDDMGEPVAATLALTGRGGSGKTTLAAAICHDDDVIDAFEGGILWITLGESPAEPAGVLAELASALTGKRLRVATLERARHLLAEALADRRCLLVIDDVVAAGDLDVFLQSHAFQYGARLITARNAAILPPEVSRIELDAEEVFVLQPDPKGPWARWLTGQEEPAAQVGAHDWALIVGIGEYPALEPNLSALARNCAQTANQFYSWITWSRGGGVPAEQVSLRLAPGDLPVRV